MSFQVFDSLSKEKRVFQPLEPGVVRMYNCGPTVYGRAHIGNLRTFLFADVLRRWLECRGLRVVQVMNITDVGHLLDDADEGEDKIEAQARREQRDPWEISRGFTELFLRDMRALGCKEPAVRPKASEHVPEMLAIIEGLLAKGFAYQVGGDVYYEVAKFPRYGRLSGNTVAELEAGARIDVREEKRHPADFALWKSDPKHLMKWTSRFGPDGFPGWHIECSAMARKHLGDQLDIHTGGEDNVFPHHECEIAQSEAFTEKPFANYWMHAKFLQVDGGKMSKRLGNVWNLDDVEARGYTPRQLRFALIRGHYRGPLNFTWGILEEAKSALAKLDDLVSDVQAAVRGERVAPDPRTGAEALAGARPRFEQGLDDDLNVPQALAALFELRSAFLEGGVGRATAQEALDFLRRADASLGVLQLTEATLDARMQQLIAARAEARARKDWPASDRIRDEIAALGVVLQDTPQGVVWRKKA
ncbi:MAG: cysteine--tRNA ligase [Planctomycetes bacterium]|nr:cysteine--tRNA ligase [Planctomycetota bacterium]